MNPLNKSFEMMFNIQLEIPLGNSGEIQKDNVSIKYIRETDELGNQIIDMLIFDNYIFPPKHKRINANGEVLELENFQFSIMYESSKKGTDEELKMKKINQRTANLLMNKGL